MDSHVSPPQPVSTNDLTIPFDWLFGTTLTGAALFFSVIWWMRGLSGRVEGNAAAIADLAAQRERDRESAVNFNRGLQQDIKRQFRTDIQQSSDEICHRFELLAVEIRNEIRRLHEKIDDHNSAISILSQDVGDQDKRLDRLETKIANVVNLKDRHD